MGRVPNNSKQFLPDIPTQPSDWSSLRRFLQGTRSAIQDYIQNPDVPDMVTGFRLSTDTGGVILKWDPSNRATNYIIYRAFDSNEFSDASAIGEVPRANSLEFFDPNGQDANATNRFYWVVATNGPKTSPISISLTTPEVAAGTGSGGGALLPNVTDQREIAPIGTLSAAAAPSSTDLTNMKVTLGSSVNWPNGTRVTVNLTGGGLTAATEYFLHAFSGTVFAFYTTIDNAYSDTSRVTLTGSITATITPDAVVFTTIPNTAVPASLAVFRNLGTDGNWYIRGLGVAPTSTVYSWKLGPGDSTLGTLGNAAAEENPPIGDLCVFHDDPTNVNAGNLSCYAKWNNGSSPGSGPTGLQGPAGPGYTATSASSLTIANSGSITAQTQAGLAYTVGARVRFYSTGSSAWMEGTVTAYSGSSMTVLLDTDSGSGTHSDWDINLAGVVGPQGIQGNPGPSGTGGSPSTCDFRLTLASGFPVYKPQPATPSSTNTGTGVVTFSTAPGWVTGTILTPASTGGGLTTGTRYWINMLTATTCKFFTSYANAIANTSAVTLSSSITQQLNPSGVNSNTLYASPFSGNAMGLYTTGWTQVMAAETSVSLGTLTSGLPYDVFAVYGTSTTFTMELLAWTNGTTRATAIALQDGVPVKSGDSTRRYLGTIYTDSTTTTIMDQGGIASQVGAKIFVWNNYHRVTYAMRERDFTATPWSYGTTNTWRQANGNTGNKVEYIIGLQREDVVATYTCFVGSASGTDAGCGVGIDSVTAVPFAGGFYTGTASGSPTATGMCTPAPGYHFIAAIEATDVGSATFCMNVSVVRIGGLQGMVWA